MYSHAEATSHVCHVAVVVDAGKESEAVDDDISCLCGLFSIGASVSDDIASESLFYLHEMFLADDMRGDDHLPRRVLLEIRDEDILVRRPAASSHEDMVGILYEGLDERQVLRLLLYLQHAVEARVADDAHISDIEFLQEFSTLFVLHEEMCETAQHSGIVATIPAEEYLVWTEDARHAIHWHITVFQDIATSDVIMTEVVIYALASLVILLLMDFYAAKRIGNKHSMGYKVLRSARPP